MAKYGRKFKLFGNKTPEFTGGAAPANLILDDYPSKAAFSWSRKMRNAFAGGGIIRVREDGGDTEADISVDGSGNLDEAAVAAHCGANLGFITDIYDQQGSANATQATLTAQPQIYDGAAVLKDNGKPAARFSAGKYLTATVSLAQAFTIFGVCSGDGASTQYLFTFDGAASKALSLRGANTIRAGFGTNLTTTATFTDNTQFQAYVLGNGVSSEVAIDNNAATTGSAGTNGATTTIVIGGANATANLVGDICELIVYESDESANRSNIQSNQNTYYGTY